MATEESLYISFFFEAVLFTEELRLQLPFQSGRADLLFHSGCSKPFLLLLLLFLVVSLVESSVVWKTVWKS